jgi:hypothetical protein
MSTRTFQKFFLRDNPFSTVPNAGVDVWADRAKLRRELDNLLTNILSSSPSRLAACFHGDWGAGKTHLAAYFSRPELLREYAKNLGVAEPISFNLITPARQVTDTLYFGILDLVDISLLKKSINTIIRPPKEVVQTVKGRVETLRPIVQDTNLATVFLGSEAPLRAYLYQTAKDRDLRELGVPRGITTDSDKLKALRATLNLLTHHYSRAILWLDDAERIREMGARDLSDFQIFMRDLLDYVPSNLSIIFLFTLGPGEKVEDTLLYLGDALLSRLYHIIRVEDMDKADFKKYVLDLLRYFRTRNVRKDVDEFFPFEGEACLEHIYEKMVERDALLKKRERGSLPMTPRNINQICSQLLEFAGRDSKLRRIDRQTVDSFMATL